MQDDMLRLSKTYWSIACSVSVFSVLLK